MSRKPISGLETALEACEFFDSPSKNAKSFKIKDEGNELMLTATISHIVKQFCEHIFLFSHRFGEIYAIL